MLLFSSTGCLVKQEVTGQEVTGQAARVDDGEGREPVEPGQRGGDAGLCSQLHSKPVFTE